MLTKLRSLNQVELGAYSHWLEDQLRGAQLQQIGSGDQILVLEFYLRRTLWLVFELSPVSPMVILVQSRRPPLIKKTKPVALFLASHGKNLFLQSIEVRSDLGRVVSFNLGNKDRSCSILATLIPRQPNLEVSADGKQISWNKPRPLQPAKSLDLKSEIEEFQIIEDLWWESKNSKDVAKELQPEGEKPSELEKVLTKKKKALAALSASVELNLKDEGFYREIGEALKITDQVPEHLKSYFDFKKSIQWNRENAFSKAKLIHQKHSGTLARIQSLEQEIARLQVEGLAENVKPRAGAQILHRHGLKARTLSLDDDVEVLCGKSAKDNLEILRRARPWDLWMHLKDYPGAHAVIFRPKGRHIGAEIFERVARWLTEQSKGIHVIGRFDVVVVEARHVRPIRGDRLGRVTYHYPQVLSFVW